MTTPRALSLFEPAEEETVRVCDLSVSSVTTKDVEEFCLRYHYLRKPGAMQWRWGLWNGPMLLGVVTYNLPTRRTQASLFGEGATDHVWHMGRLVCAPQAPRNSESRLISGSLKALRMQHPDVWAVVTFADTTQGHLGYVYQATNAIYTGLGGNSRSYIDQDGNTRSPIHGHVQYGSNWVGAERAAELGWTPVDSLPKHRYVYLLGDRRQRRDLRRLLRLTELPYPKASATHTNDRPSRSCT